MSVLFTVFAVSAFYVLLGGDSNLFGQQVPLSKDKETINLKQYLVKSDEDLGASTARIGEGPLHQMDAILVEIPPGGQLAPHRHLAEEMIYIVSGKGYTLMWIRPGDRKEQYDWAEGDMLSPSLNAWHQHFNASSDTPVRYISLTSAPLTYNVFRNTAFLSSSDFVFEERWKQGISQQPEYTPVGTEGAEVVRMRVGHHLPNLPGREMRNRRENVLGITIRPEGDMAGNQILEWELREYQSENASSPGHRHPWETVYYVIDGQGYAILQREGEPRRRVNWQKGDLFIVEANEFHEHRARMGSRPRFWQVKPAGYFHNVGNVEGEP